ncbi:nuclear pore complex protein Nup133-like [Penaeus monodon]|uniref:nuclear pore complex protein Nup133-like n=1 Tax=Penaeus monodon TaxID=6687 RepID=UPI0018A7864A|nr:nuclear pore complex protein Nup133-like [Penaeus monodon]
MYTPVSDRGGGGAANTSFTSASARAAAAAAARRRSAVGFNTSARRSPFTTPGRSTPLNRSLQASQLMEGSGQYTLESYGASLPALVMEALTFADRNVEMSAVLSQCGWAWLVCGRRLLVWRYKVDDSRRLVNHQFRELTLPPSDLAHRAQLVVVYAANEGQVPACVAASPEGFVRFWPSIAHEGSYFEVSTELQGQECDSLVFLGSSLGCLLATTTSTTLLIQPGQGSGGNQTINVRQLKVPAGLLGGISRRVSSLVFGSMPTQAPEARLVRAVAVPGAESDERSVLVLSANSLQKWYLIPNEPDKLVYECNVEKYIREGFVDHVWGRERAGATQLRVWLVDMQPTSGVSSVMVLTAAVNPQVSQQLVYALATMDTGGSAPPLAVGNFSVLKHSEYYQDSAENVLLSQRFLLCANTAYIYNKNTVLCVSAVGEGDSGDRVEFSGAGDSILGVGRSQGLPLFFSANHGIVSITPSQHLNQSSMLLNESVAEDTSRLCEALNISSVGLEAITSSQDHTARLQAAFLHFNKNNIPQAQALLDELFPGADNSTLDATVISLSTNLLDDSPATDPRWAESNEAGGTGAPMSLILQNQLRDKTTAHQYYINFLHQTGLWQRLSVGQVEETRVLTRVLLAEHAEQLAFATSLRTRHNDHQHLIDAAIRHVLNERGETPKGKLTHADLFYRRVSQIEGIIWGLLRAQEEVLAADVAPRDAPATIHSVNSLVLALLQSARVGSASISGITGTANDPPLEHIPWTATQGSRGVRTLLLEQHNTTVEVGLARAEDGATRAKLYTQMVDLADCILTGYQPQLRSLVSVSHDLHQSLLRSYERDRYNLIQPLVQGEQYDQAVGLAEKYCDFRTLVEVCDRTDNQERLSQYMTQFGSEGFSDFVFRWYLETGKRGRLLSHGDQGGLSRFLQDYTSLAWLHQIQTRDFSSASTTLRQLGLDEMTYLSRKKTLLSLSKLCNLAASVPGSADTSVMEDDTMTLEEELILYQEQLPEPVLNAHSLEADTMKVLSPTELVHLYTGDENTYANEFDFKKALDLLAFVPGEEVPELKKDIWVRAVLRNSWHHMDTDNPLEAISDTLLFKTIELAFTQGTDIKELLLPAEELLECEELGDLKEDATFKFLVNAGYEKITQLVG